MRIQPTKKPKSFLNPKDQRRLLALLAVLVLVMVASRMAANPNRWNWMFVGQQAEEGKTPAGDVDAKSDSKTTRVVPLKSGEFHATGGKDKRPPSPPKTMGDVAVARRPANLRSTVRKFGPAPEIEASSIRIHAALLSDVEDRTWDVRAEESGIYFRVLEHAARVSQSELKRVGDHVPLTVLMDSPKNHRGTPVTVEGELYQIRRLPDELSAANIRKGDANSKPIPLFDAWIRTSGSVKTPYRVVFSELPEGIDDVAKSRTFDPPVSVRVTGYFFKIQKYEIDEDRDSFAPLLLAKRIQLTKTGAAPRSLAAMPYIIGFVFLILLGLAFAIWRFSLGDKQFQRNHLQRLAEPSSDTKAAMDNLPADDNDDLFGHLNDTNSNGPNEIPAP